MTDPQEAVAAAKKALDEAEAALAAATTAATEAWKRVVVSAWNGTDALIGVTATVVALCAFALDALAIAGQTLTGRALGAGDPELTRALTGQMVRWGWGVGAVIGAVLAVASPLIPGAFTSDPDVADVLVPALVAAALVQPLSGSVFVLDGVLISAGDGRYLAAAGVVVLIAYAPLVLLVAVADAGLTWLWIAYAGFIGARWITLELRRRSERWMVLGPAAAS